MGDRYNSSTSKNTVLFVATLASFLTPFMGSSINIALPSIGREFNMDAILLGWVATSYLLSAAIFLVPCGRIADIYGRKRIFTYGIIIFILTSLLLSFSNSSEMLLIFRVLQGIGAAMIFGTGLAMITSVFPVGERGRALGINVAAVYLGLSLGPLLGGLFTENFGWRSIFLINVALGLVIIVFLYMKLKGEWAEAKGEKFDLVGSLIFGLALAAIIYGLSTLPNLSGIFVILSGILGLIFFVRWEMHTPSPVLHMDLFRRNRIFAFSNLAALINYSATFAVAFLLSLYLQYIKGLGPQAAGFILVAMPIVQAILSPVAGRLSDKIEPRLIASIGMAITTIGLVFLVFINQNTGIVYILFSLAILGLGFALFSSPNANAIMSSVGKKSYGIASATLATMRQIGMMLSMGIAMVLFAIVIGRVEIIPQYYPSFITSVRIAFGIFSALCFMGIFASLARGNVRLMKSI
ncbi:MFS transporter [Chloroflexota bacterium]